MLRSIFENILASVICALILAGIKRFLNYLKTPYEAPTKQSHPPKSLVRTQFLISLAVMAITFPFSVILPKVHPFTWLGFLKVFLFTANGFAIILAWGAFDAALVFYPSDNPANNSRNQ